MQSHLHELITGADDLIHFIKTTKVESEVLHDIHSLAGDNALLASHKDTIAAIIPLLNNKKSYVYFASIIRIYGLYEQFIEKIICDYVTTICKYMPTYDALPEKLQSDHTKLSLELIRKCTETKYKDDLNVNMASVIANLNSCLTTSNNYKLNVKAFAMHTANLWLEQLGHLLNRIGVDTPYRNIAETNTFSEYMASKLGSYTITSDQDAKSALAPLDELIYRRNEIAHGSIISEIEDTQLIIDRIEFIKELCTSICTVLVNDKCKYQVQTGQIIDIGRPIIVHNNTIACFNHDNIQLKVGNRLIVQNANNNYFTVKILSIQVDRVDRNDIDIKTPTDFAIKCDDRVKDNQTFYYYTGAY